MLLESWTAPEDARGVKAENQELVIDLAECERSCREGYATDGACELCASKYPQRLNSESSRIGATIDVRLAIAESLPYRTVSHRIV